MNGLLRRAGTGRTWLRGWSAAGIFLFAAAASAQDGKAIALQGNGHGAPACNSCHGLQGEGNAAAGFPRLAGVSAGYLSRQLAVFGDGSRSNPIMTPIARQLSGEDRQVIAIYFSALAPPIAAVIGNMATSTAVLNPGAVLAQRGRLTKGLPGCEQCHGPDGVGVGDNFPPLAAQPAVYIGNQLRAWQNGTRPAGPQALMAVIAAKLSADDIQAVSNYFAALPAVRVPSGKPQ